jgi:hypothetical protein
MVQISRRDLEKLAIGFGIADFLTEGRLSAPLARGTKAALKKAGPAIVKGLFRYGPRIAVSAARVTPGPVAAVATGAALYSQRERITDAAGNIYEKVAPPVQEYGAGVVERALDPSTYDVDFDPFRPPVSGPYLGAGKRKPSTFNKAIKKGMALVRGSTSYGKKGEITNAKRAFTMVTKGVSGARKGKKAPKSGIKRKIHTMAAKMYPKKKKTKSFNIKVRKY